MNLERLQSLVTRLFFGGAFVLMALALTKGIVKRLGGGMLGFYEPGRLLEFSAILLIVVIAILLRQIREQLASRA